MGSQIIKVTPDRDLYMEWSSVVEAPTFIGTRAELAAYLAEPKVHYRQTTIDHPEAIEERLARADETGSSGYRPFGCTWDDASGEIYQQRGHLRRDRFAEFCDRILAAQDFDLDFSDLLEPFED